MAGTWQSLNQQPPVAVDTMLLLTDGSIMCHSYESPNWYRLVPDAYSDYANGAWHAVTPMPANAPTGQNGPADAPLYYASAVLRDGRVFVAGGEYNGGSQVDLRAAEIYDPVSDSWTNVPTPPGWSNIGDAPTCVLPDGRILIGNINTTETAILDPRTKTWTSGGAKHDASSEETYTLLPDGTILVAEVDAHPKAEKYLIASGQWVSAGSTPPGHDLVLNVSGVSIEIGPAILMPDGRVFCAGASGHTALYTPPLNPTHAGSWAPGPDFPLDSHGNLMRAFDAPACLLPNGKVLCVAGQVITSGGDAGWAGEPSSFFEFDGLTLVPVAGPASAASVPTYNCRMLLLPTGQVLFSTCTGTLEMYSPDGSPLTSWRPEITNVPHELARGHSFKLLGRQLNGLSQAVSYGDDAQMATNYPLVRLRGTAGVGTFYCRTFDHETMAVATGHEIVHTHFEVAASLPLGEYELTVIANGIASHPVRVRVHHEEPVRHREREEREAREGRAEREERFERIRSGRSEDGELRERIEHLGERLDRIELVGSVTKLAERLEHIEKLESIERAYGRDAGKRSGIETSEHENGERGSRPPRSEMPKARR